MVGLAKLRYRPFKHDASSGRVFWRSFSYLHSAIFGLRLQAKVTLKGRNKLTLFKIARR